MAPEKLTRREFLTKTATGIVFAGFAGSSLIELARIPPNPPLQKGGKSLSFGGYHLAAAKGGKFASPLEAAYNRLKEAVDVFGGMSPFVKGKRVLIKVNAVDNKHQLGNTSSEVAGAVVKLCRESGAKSVTVLSHDTGWDTPSGKHPTLRKAIAKQGGVVLALTNKRKDYVKQPVNAGGWRDIYVAKLLYEPDTVLINVPRAKTHPWTCYTMCVKNLMGLTLQMNHFHGGDAKWTDFPVRMSTAYKYVFKDKVAINILDATNLVYGWHSPAPEKMRAYEENTIVVGLDALAVDAYGIEMFRKRDREKFMPALGGWNRKGNFYAKNNWARGNYIKECYALEAGEADITKLKVKSLNLNI
ncbi:MAG: DUF362 domain-containing protein [Candidatus Poribacteria bacterium]